MFLQLECLSQTKRGQDIFNWAAAIFGVYGSAEVEVYKQTSKVSDGDVVLTKPMFGYMYYQKAQGNANAVMDFSRLNDKEVTPATPVYLCTTIRL